VAQVSILISQLDTMTGIALATLAALAGRHCVKCEQQLL